MRKPRGFLLFEIMVAVTMVGIAMATVLQSISFSLVTARVTRDYEMASALLSQKMWEVTSLPSAEPGSSQGTFSEHPGFRYTVVVEDLLPGEASDDPSIIVKSLAKITVTLFWEFRGKTKQLMAQTYMPVVEEDEAEAFPMKFLA